MIPFPDDASGHQYFPVRGRYGTMSQYEAHYRLCVCPVPRPSHLQVILRRIRVLLRSMHVMRRIKSSGAVGAVGAVGAFVQYHEIRSLIRWVPSVHAYPRSPRANHREPTLREHNASVRTCIIMYSPNYARKDSLHKHHSSGGAVEARPQDTENAHRPLSRNQTTTDPHLSEISR